MVWSARLHVPSRLSGLGSDSHRVAWGRVAGWSCRAARFFCMCRNPAQKVRQERASVPPVSPVSSVLYDFVWIPTAWSHGIDTTLLGENKYRVASAGTQNYRETPGRVPKSSSCRRHAEANDFQVSVRKGVVGAGSRHARGRLKRGELWTDIPASFAGMGDPSARYGCGAPKSVARFPQDGGGAFTGMHDPSGGCMAYAVCEGIDPGTPVLPGHRN